MDDEIEDIIGDIKYTDSQKSVTASNVYSLDFTDSGSDRNNSSSKETYIIERDDSDDSDRTFKIHKSRSIIDLRGKVESSALKPDKIFHESQKINIAACTSFQKCSIVSQEIFTQTSKTIFELVEKETGLTKSINNHTLETQTSFVSIIENASLQYRVKINRNNVNFQKTNNNLGDCSSRKNLAITNNVLNSSLEEKSSNILNSDSDRDIRNYNYDTSDYKIIQFTEEESQDNLSKKLTEYQFVSTSDFESSKYDSDIEEDSLMESTHGPSKTDNVSYKSHTPKSVDDDVEELYNKLSESVDILRQDRPIEQEAQLYRTLTPLTEETANKKESIIDMTPNITTANSIDDSGTTLFTNHAGIKIKILPNENETINHRDSLKLPPIQKHQMRPNKTINVMFSIYNSNKDPRLIDRWEIGSKELASGESPLISGRSDLSKVSNGIQLPPIHIEGVRNNTQNNSNIVVNAKLQSLEETTCGSQFDTISIQERIGELKMNNRKSRQRSRNGSPSRVSSPEDSRHCDAAERGCDSLCSELLRKLRSSSWLDVSDTLEGIPNALEKYWGIISEYRIADIIRQVSIQVESPRTQVARTACACLAAVLKNTNYTKKPDFYEAMTVLLTKTGSFSRPVRRAANIALDDIVCGVDLTHAITALCVHGVGHKSALVRCASARLLVVCCALAEGGRTLLRNRPPTAATARRHALRSLAVLLDDKNLDVRKYAERLYCMLRPLANFDAYFLTDVDVELATRLLKKCDQTCSVKKHR